MGSERFAWVLLPFRLGRYVVFGATFGTVDEKKGVVQFSSSLLSPPNEGWWLSLNSAPRGRLLLLRRRKDFFLKKKFLIKVMSRYFWCQKHNRCSLSFFIWIVAKWTKKHPPTFFQRNGGVLSLRQKERKDSFSQIKSVKNKSCFFFSPTPPDWKLIFLSWLRKHFRSVDSVSFHGINNDNVALCDEEKTNLRFHRHRWWWYVVQSMLGL